MDSIRLAFDVVFPLFVMMAAGYMTKLAGWVDDETLTKMNAVTFRVFLSILIFMNIYNGNIMETFSGEMAVIIAICWAAVFLFIFGSMTLLKKWVPDRKRRSVMTQGIYRGNLVLYGIPVATVIGGAEAAARASILIATVVPLFNFMAVVLLERARSHGTDVKHVLKKIIKNPLIIASVLGVLCSVLRIRIPEVLLSPLDSMSKVGTPLSFVILGATLDFKRFFGNLKPLLAVCLGKLVLVPAVVFSLALLAGVPKIELAALVGAMASPSAVSSFSMAKEMGVDGDFAGQIVVLTSVLSIITLFFWVAGLKAAGAL